MRIICLLLILICTGCSTSKEWRYPPVSSQDEHHIYIVNHGWHTGIIISAEILEKHYAFLRTDFAAPQFYEIGWGDHDFYQAERETLGLAIQALLWPSDSVVHAVGFSLSPQEYFYNADLVALSLSSEGMTHLLDYIKQSFHWETDEVKKLQKGLYGQSWFYQGEGTFFLLNTCNSWTAKALDQAGVPVKTFLTFTAEGVMQQAREAIASDEGE